MGMLFMELAMRACIGSDRMFATRNFNGNWTQEQKDGIHAILDAKGEPRESDAMYNTWAFWSEDWGFSAKRATWDTILGAATYEGLLDKLTRYCKGK